MKLGELDARAIVRLVGDVVTPGGHAEKKRRLMDGLCKLVDADYWVWGLSCQREPDKPQVYVSFIRGHFSEEQFVRFLQAVEHPEMISVASAYFEELKRVNIHLTRSRYQITTPEKLRASGADLAWKEADIGPTILSLRPLDPKSSSTVGLYRKFGRPEFTDRDTRVAHIALAEIPWLHEQGWPEDRGVDVPALPHRKRLALNLLLEGDGQKAIADKMSISMHTARGYIKDLYRTFNVHSQAELMRRFYEGNGHDKG